jgi:exodeoxyribonuclease VII small subunit
LKIKKIKAKANKRVMMAKNDEKNDINKLSFEQAIKELTGIVGEIEQGEITLDESLQQYERGMSLIKRCRTILQDAEKRIEKISGPGETPQELQQNANDVPF